ncbi:MAG: hypothetical protein J6Y28_02595 [Acholeplasmatales bacterium]|nr:hypothetical protein [Acholeplasmatales bacterium]
MTKYKLGIELEFIVEGGSYLPLLTYFNNKYNAIFSMDYKYSSLTDIVLKPDPTIKGGLEINIPPTYTDKLEDICEDLNQFNIIFDDKCAMHIHVDAANIDIGKLYNYYKDNESSILQEAKKLNLLPPVSLNSSVTNIKFKYTNMNIWQAYIQHGTVEHRIYKSTINSELISLAIKQTIEVIEKSQS